MSKGDSIEYYIIRQRQMAHADWLICGLEKVILPARVNLVKVKFQRKLKLIRPYSDDEKHSPSEFYYPGETNNPNIYG